MRQSRFGPSISLFFQLSSPFLTTKSEKRKVIGLLLPFQSHPKHVETYRTPPARVSDKNSELLAKHIQKQALQ